MGEAPWPATPAEQAHCAVCHWLRSLRAFTPGAVVVVAAGRLSTELPPRTTASARHGTPLHRASRAPPAVAA